MLTVGSAGADPALAAVEEAGLSGKVKTGTFDLSPTILQAVDAGKMEWGIDAQQYLMGYVPVVMFDLMKRYKLAPIEDYPTGPGFVDQGGSGDDRRSRQAGRALICSWRPGRMPWPGRRSTITN